MNCLLRLRNHMTSIKTKSDNSENSNLNNCVMFNGIHCICKEIEGNATIHRSNLKTDNLHYNFKESRYIKVHHRAYSRRPIVANASD